MPAKPRRTCPACAHRYAGLIAPDCPICRGLGTLTLGAAALAHFDTAAVARAVDLYLEAYAQQARDQLPLGDHRQALEAAVDNLAAAGVLHPADTGGTPARTPAPHDAASAYVTELDAYRATRALGAVVTPRITAALATPPLASLAGARPRDGRVPTASANGHTSATATIADPIYPLGPDTAVLDNERAATTHRAAVIATAVPQAATRRRRQEGTR